MIPRHAYRKAVSIIRAVPYKISSHEDVKNIRGIGTKIREKVTEIITTGKLRKAELLTVCTCNFTNS
jgi:DNA polymerase lambda